MNCFESPQLNVVYTGKDNNGDCTFQADVMATAISPYSILSYDWQYPGSGGWTSSGSSVNFTMSDPQSSEVRVRVYARRTSTTTPTAAYCCDIELAKDVDCDGTGTSQPKP